MKKLRILSLILTICLIFSAAAPAAFASEPPKTSAAAVVIADINSDLILYSVGMHEKRDPASLTKIMTILLAVEAIESGRARLEDMVEAMEDCRVGMDSSSSTADIYPGEIMSLKDLLYCAMLPSANEACNIIARYLGGSISGFVDMMNARAAELGCESTHFMNPNGLTENDHYTTAYDLMLMTRCAVKKPLFLTVCDTISYDTAATNASDVRHLKNSNALICTDSIYGSGYVYKGASGVKTGHTSAAGFCLVSTAQREGISLVCVVLGCEGNYDSGIFNNFEDSIALYNWAFSNFQYNILLTISDGVKKVDVDLAKDDAVAILRPETDVRLLLPKTYDPSQLTVNTTVYEDLLVAPIEAGTVLGSADILINGERYATINLITNATIELSRGEMLKRQLKNITSSVWFKVCVIFLVIVIALYFGLVVSYRKKRQKQLREKRMAEMRRKQEWQRRYQEQEEARTNGREPTQSFDSTDASRYFDDYFNSHDL